MEPESKKFLGKLSHDRGNKVAIEIIDHLQLFQPITNNYVSSAGFQFVKSFLGSICCNHLSVVGQSSGSHVSQLSQFSRRHFNAIHSQAISKIAQPLKLKAFSVLLLN